MPSFQEWKLVLRKARAEAKKRLKAVLARTAKVKAAQDALADAKKARYDLESSPASTLSQLQNAAVEVHQLTKKLNALLASIADDEKQQADKERPNGRDNESDDDSDVDMVQDDELQQEEEEDEDEDEMVDMTRQDGPDAD